MSAIVLNPGLTWDTLPEAKDMPLVNLDALQTRIESLRAEWAQSDADPDARRAVLAVLDELLEMTEE